MAFFGRRSVRAGFFGILAFLLPLTALQIAVSKDRTSSLLPAPYSAQVIGYDVPWTLQLWRAQPPFWLRSAAGPDTRFRQ